VSTDIARRFDVIRVEDLQIKNVDEPAVLGVRAATGRVS
jgi:hypothetical protein